MNVDLDIMDYVLIASLVGLAIAASVLAFGRLRFAQTHAAFARDGNENVPAKDNPPLRHVQRYVLLSVIQLAFDVSIVGFFAYFIYLRFAYPAPGAFLEALPPIWPWLIVGAARIGIELPIRATRRKIMIFTWGEAQWRKQTRSAR